MRLPHEICGMSENMSLCVHVNNIPHGMCTYVCSYHPLCVFTRAHSMMWNDK